MPIGLTTRQRELVRMVAEGGTNRQIASALFISENTVKTHLSKVRAKLKLRNRAQIAYWAARNNGDTEMCSIENVWKGERVEKGSGLVEAGQSMLARSG